MDNFIKTNLSDPKDVFTFFIQSSYECSIINDCLDLSSLTGYFATPTDEKLISFFTRVKDPMYYPLISLCFYKAILQTEKIIKKIKNDKSRADSYKNLTRTRYISFEEAQFDFYTFLMDYRIFFLFYAICDFAFEDNVRKELLNENYKSDVKDISSFKENFGFLLKIGKEYKEKIVSFNKYFLSQNILENNKNAFIKHITQEEKIHAFLGDFVETYTIFFKSNSLLRYADNVLKKVSDETFKSTTNLYIKFKESLSRDNISLSQDIQKALTEYYRLLFTTTNINEDYFKDFLMLFPFYFSQKDSGYYSINTKTDTFDKPIQLCYLKARLKGYDFSFEEGIVSNLFDYIVIDAMTKIDGTRVSEYLTISKGIDFFIFYLENRLDKLELKERDIFLEIYKQKLATNDFLESNKLSFEEGHLVAYEFIANKYLSSLLESKEKELMKEFEYIEAEINKSLKESRGVNITPATISKTLSDSFVRLLSNRYFPVNYEYLKNEFQYNAEEKEDRKLLIKKNEIFLITLRKILTQMFRKDKK